MPIYVAERTFATPISLDAFKANGPKLMECIQARDITWLGTNLATDGRRSICMFEADDAERIYEAANTAGVPYDKVWAALALRP